MSAKRGPDDESGKQKVAARLRSVEGHLRGVLQMLEDDAYCMDVLRQTKAIHAALSKVEGLILERHLHHCVSTAVRSDKPRERERVLSELVLLFQAKGEKER
jgi:DNA-binding FrmR family transcriptional regulator